jgi:hypothetical protein
MKFGVMVWWKDTEAEGVRGQWLARLGTTRLKVHALRFEGKAEAEKFVADRIATEYLERWEVRKL